MAQRIAQAGDVVEPELDTERLERKQAMKNLRSQLKLS
jgi:hypothetical protein